MNKRLYLKTALLTLTVSALLVTGWELFWRAKGYKPTFNDDKNLWAAKRKAVYQPRENATVFIGSSRIKFDLDLPEWRKLTGEDAVQLALVGTSPIEVLKDLAADEKFNGKLVVDVTEGLFFSQNPVFHKLAKEATAFYKMQTVSEKISSQLNFLLEAKLAFLEERRFSLNTLLNDLEIPNRPGVFSFPSFPKGFEWTTADRQTYMSDMFLNSREDVKRQTDIWRILIMGDKTPVVQGEALVSIFKEIKQAVDKIKERGGKVIFVRTPSSGVLGDGEKIVFPREKYWGALLAYAGVEGIHFSDNPNTAGLICPEWSHLSPAGAVVYTKYFVEELNQKGWFNHSTAKK
jgi:hypothetical protein